MYRLSLFLKDVYDTSLEMFIDNYVSTSSTQVRTYVHIIMYIHIVQYTIIRVHILYVLVLSVCL